MSNCKFCKNKVLDVIGNFQCLCYGDHLRMMCREMKDSKVERVEFKLDSDNLKVIKLMTLRGSFFIGITESFHYDKVFPAISNSSDKLIPASDFFYEMKYNITDEMKGDVYIKPFDKSHREKSKNALKTIKTTADSIKKIKGKSIRWCGIKKDWCYNDVLVIDTGDERYYITLRDTKNIEFPDCSVSKNKKCI